MIETRCSLRDLGCAELQEEVHAGRLQPRRTAARYCRRVTNSEAKHQPHACLLAVLWCALCAYGMETHDFGTGSDPHIIQSPGRRHLFKGSWVDEQTGAWIHLHYDATTVRRTNIVLQAFAVESAKPAHLQAGRTHDEEDMPYEACQC
jgi:hypothetical protein